MKILLLNVWDRNRGDEALTRSFASLLKEVEPRAQVAVSPLFSRPLDFSINEVENLRVYCSAYLSPRIYWRRKVLNALKRLPVFKKLIPQTEIIAADMAMDEAKRGFPHLRDFLQQFDFVFLAPQGQILSASHPMFDYALYSLEATAAAGVPYALMGISVGPFDGMSPDRLERLHRIFKGAKSIILREELSLQYMQKQFPDVTGIQTAIDVVFLLASVPELQSNLKVEAAQSGVGKIGSCISLSRTEQTRDLPKAEFFDVYANKMAAFYDHIIETTGKRLLLFPHIDHDVEIIEKIIARMKQSAQVDQVEFGLDDRGHRKLIGEVDFFVSTRYHPTIFSILTGRPFMSVIQHFKVRGALNTIGLFDNYCEQDDDLSAYITLFDRLWNERDTLAPQVLAARTRAVELTQVYKDTVKWCFKNVK